MRDMQIKIYFSTFFFIFSHYAFPYKPWAVFFGYAVISGNNKDEESATADSSGYTTLLLTSEVGQ